MKIKVWEAALIAAVIISILAGSAAASQRELSEKLIRLHVVAASDSETDQELKLKVRDAVLKSADGLLYGANNAGEAKELLTGGLSEIEMAADTAVKDNGYDYPVTVTLGRESFPTREYDTFSLPAGDYTSLRVTIGEGKGKNWWCVCYPPLCESAAVSFEDAGLTDKQVMLITGDTDSVKIKFFALEMLQKLKGLFI